MMKAILYTQKIKFNRLIGIFTINLFLFSFQINAQTITGITATKAQFCVGTPATFSFKVTNGIGSANHFTSSTNYILYYSNGGGFIQVLNFTSTVAPVGDGGTATISKTVTIPTTFPTGNKYRISVGSTNPNIDGSTGANASGAFTVSNPKARMDKRYPVSQCGGGADGEIIIDTANSKGIQPFQISSNGINNTTSQRYLFNNLVPGNYHIIAKDAAGCTAFDSTIVISNAVPMVVSTSHIGDVSSCGGNDGTLTTKIVGGIEPIQVSLDDLNYQTKGNYVINNLKSDTPYIITVKDFRGCKASSSPIVLKSPSPIIVGTNNIIGESACGTSDGVIYAKAGGGVLNPVLYNLNAVPPGNLSKPYQSSNLFNNLPTGNYVIGVLDSKGCTGSVSVTVPKNPPITAAYYNINKVTTCNGTDGSIIGRGIGGAAPFQYSLSGPVNIPFQNSNYFTNLPVGTYTETVKDSRNCEATTTLVVSGPFCPSPRESNSSLSHKIANPSLSVQVMPNPTSSQFTLLLRSLSKNKISLIVSDMYGNIVYNNTGSGNHSYSFGNGFPSGIYVVKILQGKQVQTIKLIKN
jgi:hypothetical protein